MRLTRQRQILLDLIDKTGQHLDAERLFHMAQEKDPKLNRVTVYRTLKLLKEGGLVDELDLMHQAGEQHFYETRRKQEHAHGSASVAVRWKSFSESHCNACAARSKLISALRSCLHGPKSEGIARIVRRCEPENLRRLPR